jgi:hypothetical protein
LTSLRDGCGTCGKRHASHEAAEFAGHLVSQKVRYMDQDTGNARATAGRLMLAFPAWLVLWGSYTRQFWAFPGFAAPPGTVLHGRDPDVLAGAMNDVQRAMAGGQR